VQSKEIDDMLRQENQANAITPKVLLLGAGESGKTTIFKQASSLYNHKPTREDLERTIPIIMVNVFEAICTLMDKANVLHAEGKIPIEISEESRESVAFIQEVRSKNSFFRVNGELAMHVKTLWEDPAIQETLKLRSSFQYNETASYFLEKLDEISDPEYIPSFADLLRARSRTTGVTVIDLMMDNRKVLIVDVGGQKSERAKWIHQFEGVTSILYVCAIDDYDRTMFEDEKTNRMVDSLQLFENTINLHWFNKTIPIVFLNKRDLFLEKFPKVSLGRAFPDWDDSVTDPEKAYDFIAMKFIERLQDERKQIIFHVTCATDTDNIRIVFEAVKAIILGNRMKAIGL